MKNHNILFYLSLVALIILTSCEEESLLITMDDEEWEDYFEDDYNDDDESYKPFVYFYHDQVSEGLGWKSSFISANYDWQISAIGQEPINQYDFSFDRLYAYNPTVSSEEAVLLLNEQKDPTIIYFKDSYSDAYSWGLFEFEVIDNNQFYLRIHHIDSYTQITTLLFETIIFVDEDDFYGNTTFVSEASDFNGGRKTGGRKSVFSNSKNKKRKDFSGARKTSTSTIDEGVLEYVADLETFYSSTVTKWISMLPELGMEILYERIYTGSNLPAEVDIQVFESLLNIYDLSTIIYEVDPENYREIYASLKSGVQELLSGSAEAQHYTVGYYDDLRSLDAYNHWLVGVSDFNELKQVHEDYNLFQPKSTFDRLMTPDGGLQVNLAWSGEDADLNLLLVDPFGDTLSVEHTDYSGTGTILKENSEAQYLNRELAYWGASAPEGTYTVLVEIGSCNNGCTSAYADVFIADGIGGQYEQYISLSEVDKPQTVAKIEYAENSITILE